MTSILRSRTGSDPARRIPIAPWARLALCVPLWLSAAAATAQEAGYPLAEDVATLDGIMRAYYEVVSGPAGVPRDWARDRSLHHPDALVTILSVDDQARPTARTMTLAEYHERSGEVAREPFYEREIHRVVDRFGNIANVWSTYEWRRDEAGPVMGRGINNIQLYHDGDRWWITSWSYDSEREGNPIPPEYGGG